MSPVCVLFINLTLTGVCLGRILNQASAIGAGARQGADNT